MPEFDSLFKGLGGGQSVLYNGLQIRRSDRFPVKNGDMLVCSIEKAVKKKSTFKDFVLK